MVTKALKGTNSNESDRNLSTLKGLTHDEARHVISAVRRGVAVEPPSLAQRAASYAAWKHDFARARSSWGVPRAILFFFLLIFASGALLATLIRGDRRWIDMVFFVLFAFVPFGMLIYWKQAARRAARAMARNRTIEEA